MSERTEVIIQNLFSKFNFNYVATYFNITTDKKHAIFYWDAEFNTKIAQN